MQSVLTIRLLFRAFVKYEISNQNRLALHDWDHLTERTQNDNKICTITITTHFQVSSVIQLTHSTGTINARAKQSNINLQQKQSIFYNQLKITVQLGKWQMESNWFFNNLARPSLYYATCITQQLDPKPLVLFTFLGTHLCIKRYRRNRRVQSEHVIAEERLHTQSQAVHVPRHGSRGGKNCFFSDGPK